MCFESVNAGLVSLCHSIETSAKVIISIECIRQDEVYTTKITGEGTAVHTRQCQVLTATKQLVFETVTS